ncbi:MAG TPA: beta-ketoacyl-ACP synthase [Rhodanobacter sp.]|nr:beta-ketoacyl-ACP synthase [Rhodanobacter sp.]
MTPLAVSAFTATSALGGGLAAHVDALRADRSGLRPNDFGSLPHRGWIGRVAGVEATTLPAPLADWDCRNHRLAWLGLQQDGFRARVAAARTRYGTARVALVVGTSTASIGATEEAYRTLDADGGFPPGLRFAPLHAPDALSAFLRVALDLAGPCLTISTACSSSAKVFASAARLLALDLADAVVVGGVDSLCGNVLFGFNALELIAPDACRPFDAHRAGLSLGEAAGFALLERTPAAPHAPRLLGYGEASDAWHMSAPHPEGVGAERALDAALASAGLDAGQVDYVNLHGTASRQNDAVEAALIARRFPAHARASSTKGATGHTLGAAGALEAAIALLAIAHDLVPGTVGTREPDPACTAAFAWHSEQRRVDVALSNSFGFGGNDACLVFGRAP